MDLIEPPQGLQNPPRLFQRQAAGLSSLRWLAIERMRDRKRKENGALALYSQPFAGVAIREAPGGHCLHGARFGGGFCLWVDHQGELGPMLRRAIGVGEPQGSFTRRQGPDSSRHPPSP